MIGTSSIIKLILVSGMALGIGSAFWYVTGLQADLQRSQSNVNTLETAVEEQQAAIDNMRQEQREIRARRNQINEMIEEQRNEIADLRSRFDTSSSGDERSLAALAREKPQLVENIINSASDEAARCIEIASGAELTQEERNATKRSEINSECPSIANPSYSADP